ncbi:hypothetical protein E2C01_096079 [Portunus trituberculatus]|uniref:Uncharacterized protein n=1 Tax=Portunus trituberculatus TaxID=210409 RepID=A0A5B7K241_PORTR|nr:hypothetical protein [Portunus trituberculatus]
MRSSPWCPWGL